MTKKEFISKILLVSFISTIHSLAQATTMMNVQNTELTSGIQNKIIKIHSLQDVEDYVKNLIKSGYTPHDILLSFDFDGTLSERKEDKDHKKSSKLLMFLEEESIPYFVNTAAKSGTGEIHKTFVEGKKFGYQPKPQDFWKPKQQGEKECPYYLSKDTQHKNPFYIASQFKINMGGDDVQFYHCGLAFSAYYDKEKVITYVVSLLSHKPKVVIHVDDSSSMALGTYLMTNQQKEGNYQIISMYFPPLEKPKISGEPGQEEAEEEINKILKEE